MRRFRYGRLYSLIRLGLVSRRWNQLVYESVETLRAMDVSSKMRDGELRRFVNLTSFEFPPQERRLSDEGLKSLLNLRSLKFPLVMSRPKMISGISGLVNLTSLELFRNAEGLTGEGISHLTNLTRLVVRGVSAIGDGALKRLTGLTSLELFSSCSVTDDGISQLTNLATLALYGTDDISDNGLLGLTNLTCHKRQYYCRRELFDH